MEVFELKNSKGVRTGGVFQFLRMLNKEVRCAGDYFPVVVFDNGLSSRRTDLYDDYKKALERAKQDAMVLTPEESDIDYVTQYRKQRNLLSVMLPYFGIPAIKIAGWEGDDLIYILTQLAADSIILTDDKDMLQLLSDTCKVRRPMADELWTLDGFLESNQYESIRDFVIYKALLGDNSDNIPSSCAGVGMGTVNELVKLIKLYLESSGEGFEYPKTDKELKAICEQSGVKYRKAYLNWNKDQYAVNLQLVDLGLVEINARVVESIMANIRNSENLANYFSVIKFLSDLEITEFSPDDLMRETKLKRTYLWRSKDGHA